MINTLLLKGKIVASGNTQSVIAKKMGLSETSLSAKINGKARFYSDEVLKMCDIIGVESADELAKIFYPSIPKKG